MNERPAGAAETVDTLLARLADLQKQEEMLDKEMQELHASGIDEHDSADIMDALHSYNEIKDTVSEVFSILSKLKNTTALDLHVKYNIPLE